MSEHHCDPDWEELSSEQLSTVDYSSLTSSYGEHPFPFPPSEGFPFPDGPHGGPGHHGPPPPGGPGRGGEDWDPDTTWGPTIYRATYSLPTTLDSVYFLSRGAHSYGHIRYEDTEDGKGDAISVNVSMRYWNKEARESVKMCILSKGDGHMGFGIFVSSIHTFRAQSC